jgi:roadblock/LC7 domain-containing protein
VQKTALAWSPDGSQLAYAALRDGLSVEVSGAELSSIYVVRSDGADKRLLCDACSRTAYAHAYEPSDVPFNGSALTVPGSLAWSTNDSMIAAPAAGRGVLLIDTGTGESSTIPTPEPVTALAWSPDGRRLALSHTWFMTPGNAFGVMVQEDGTVLEGHADRRGGIYVLDVDTGALDEVVATDGMAHVQGWSPDGDLIAYTSTVSKNRHGQLAAYSVAEDRSWPLVEAELGQAGIGAGWSPAGDRFAALTDQYDEQAQQAKDLWVVSSDGTDRRGLPICRFEGAFDGDECARATIAWSPDGTTVAYRAFLSGTPIVSALIFRTSMARPPGSCGSRDRHSTSEKARAASRGFPRPAEARSSSTGSGSSSASARSSATVGPKSSRNRLAPTLRPLGLPTRRA